MPYLRDRKIFHQFEFAPVTGPTGISTLESIGTRDIVVQKPDPEWLTLSATGLVSLAASLDEQKKDNFRSSPNPRSILARYAGSALHLMHELMILYEETLPPNAPTTSDAWRQFQENLDTRLEKLLPTTPPRETLAIRRLLEDRAVVFPRANDHPGLVEAGYRYLSRKILEQRVHQPPLTATKPLSFDEDACGDEPFPDPEVLDVLWNTTVAPSLRAKVNHLIQWHEGTSQVLGRTLSVPTEAHITGLPELNVVVIAPALHLTLAARTDETTRWVNRFGNAELMVTDLKSGTHVHVPPEGSLEDVADKTVTYLLATVMSLSNTPRQEKPGYALEYHSDTGVENPRTLSPEDHVRMPVVALGQYPPEVVDNAQRFEPILTDPIAAQAMLGKTEDLLDQIRERRLQKVRPLKV